MSAGYSIAAKAVSGCPIRKLKVFAKHSPVVFDLLSSVSIFKGTGPPWLKS